MRIRRSISWRHIIYIYKFGECGYRQYCLVLEFISIGGRIHCMNAEHNTTKKDLCELVSLNSYPNESFPRVILNIIFLLLSLYFEKIKWSRFVLKYFIRKCCCTKIFVIAPIVSYKFLEFIELSMQPFHNQPFNPSQIQTYSFQVHPIRYLRANFRMHYWSMMRLNVFF